jgi:hypothetical protein
MDTPSLFSLKQGLGAIRCVFERDRATAGGNSNRLLASHAAALGQLLFHFGAATLVVAEPRGSASFSEATCTVILAGGVSAMPFSMA